MTRRAASRNAVRLPAREPAVSREWPPARPEHRTAEPNQPLDLSDAADNYAQQIPEAVKRRNGFQLGDPVRRRL